MLGFTWSDEKGLNIGIHVMSVWNVYIIVSSSTHAIMVFVLMPPAKQRCKTLPAEKIHTLCHHSSNHAQYCQKHTCLFPLQKTVGIITNASYPSMSASDPSFCLIGQMFILNLNCHMEFGCKMINVAINTYLFTLTNHFPLFSFFS